MFFFSSRRRHTRYWRDWSSDVCSSDLVYTLESFYEANWRHVPVSSLDPFWPLQMGFQLARNSPYHYLKRLFDVGVAGALLVFSSPFIAAITCAIWMTSGRPAIFRQPRVGREGQVFTAYKFRTMQHAY